MRDESLETVREQGRAFRALADEIGRAIVGQEYMVERLLVGLLTGGHVLIEGVPGLAKTLAVNTLARAVRASFHRIQFTPDLLPADLVGTMVYDPKKTEFFTRKGPIFTHFLLADEINRAPAKVQSALLEAMQERQVTIGTETHRLEDPFLVLATQNPIEQEGTYPLPEAQVDRFMLKLRITYPTREEERKIMDRWAGVDAIEVRPVAELDEIRRARETIRSIRVDENLKEYMVDIVHATRDSAGHGLDLKDLIAYGASPRATLYLNTGSRALAFLDGRDYVTADDVKEICPDVLRHRIIVTYEAEAEEVTSEEIIRKILDHLEVP
ncbi:MAG: AAA family ATPase [Candidatus Latescibacterota bacterium]|nr:MAG: AAA family ATPase [Candidatus Latescibacterota bacterium]